MENEPRVYQWIDKAESNAKQGIVCCADQILKLIAEIKRLQSEGVVGWLQEEAAQNRKWAEKFKAENTRLRAEIKHNDVLLELAQNQIDHAVKLGEKYRKLAREGRLIMMNSAIILNDDSMWECEGCGEVYHATGDDPMKDKLRIYHTLECPLAQWLEDTKET
jgi:hypothetical protein